MVEKEMWNEVDRKKRDRALTGVKKIYRMI